MISNISNNTFIIILIGSMIVTYIPRMLPLTILRKIKLSKKIELFLENIPIAILGSILASSVFVNNGELNFSLNNDVLIISIILIFLSRFLKRLDLIVFVGILLMAVYRFIK
jgi:branched-subunit amino acid transport protein